MKPTRRASYTVDPRRVYSREIELIQGKLDELNGKLAEVLEEKIAPDNISWADVGAANRMRLILNEALEIEF
jgi:hypothetical protein